MNYSKNMLTEIIVNENNESVNNNTISINTISLTNSVNTMSTVTTIPTINITSNIASNATSRPATLPISSPFGPPSDNNLGKMIKSSTTEDLDATGLVASLATPKGTPIDAIKEWSISTYKCAKQLVNERLGKCQRTIDSVLESEIDHLRDTQKKYLQILNTSSDMVNTYSNLISQQNLLYKSLNEIATKENMQSEKFLKNGNLFNKSSLAADFKKNAEMFQSISKNGEKLILALRFFCSNLQTLIYKTIDDTMITIKAYENARLEYDAEKNSVANLLPAQAASASNMEKLIATKAKYERLKADVAVKLQFLEENKMKVMHKQMVLFYNTFASYASGNENTLESTLKQFGIKSVPIQSWLEK